MKFAFSVECREMYQGTEAVQRDLQQADRELAQRAQRVQSRLREIQREAQRLLEAQGGESGVLSGEEEETIIQRAQPVAQEIKNLQDDLRALTEQRQRVSNPDEVELDAPDVIDSASNILQEGINPLLSRPLRGE